MYKTVIHTFVIGFLISIIGCNDSSEAENFIRKGDEKSDRKDYFEALADYTKAIELDPNNVKAYSKRGFVKSYLSDERGAVADHTSAIKIDPNNADSYFNRGMAKLRLKQNDSACLDLSKSGELGNASAYDAIKKYCN